MAVADVIRLLYSSPEYRNTGTSEGTCVDVRGLPDLRRIEWSSPLPWRRLSLRS